VGHRRRLDHIAIAVRNLESSLSRWTALLGIEPSEVEIHSIESEGVRVAMLPLADGVMVELMEPLSDQSPVARFLERRGEGIHHFALRSKDPAKDLARAREIGLEAVGDGPVETTVGDLVAFLHPRSLNGVLLEFKQRREERSHGGGT